LEPFGGSRVQALARGARQALVDGVAEERVGKHELVVVRAEQTRSFELLAFELVAPGNEQKRLARGALPENGGREGDLSRVPRETIEAGEHHGADRTGQRGFSRGGGPQQLIEEQRKSFGTGDARSRRSFTHAGVKAGERECFGLGQRRKVEACRGASARTRAKGGVEDLDLRSRREHDEQRRARRDGSDLAQDFPLLGGRPVQIFEHEHERCALRAGEQQPRERGDARSLVRRRIAGERPGSRFRAERCLHQLAE
jgi:hypothetical protein